MERYIESTFNGIFYFCQFRHCICWRTGKRKSFVWHPTPNDPSREAFNGCMDWLFFTLGAVSSLKKVDPLRSLVRAWLSLLVHGGRVKKSLVNDSDVKVYPEECSFYIVSPVFVQVRGVALCQGTGLQKHFWLSALLVHLMTRAGRH